MKGMRKLLFPGTPRWYWLTRSLGLVTFLNELFIDVHSADRSAIMIAAAGLMGLDRVAREREDEPDEEEIDRKVSEEMWRYAKWQAEDRAKREQK